MVSGAILQDRNNGKHFEDQPHGVHGKIYFGSKEKFFKHGLVVSVSWFEADHVTDIKNSRHHR